MVAKVGEHRVFRSREAFVGGVCAGIAERYDFDAIVIRILAVLLSFVTFGVAAIVYVVLWVRLPQEAAESGPYEVTPERAESHAYGSVDCDLDLRALLDSGCSDSGKLNFVARLAVAVGLMLLFLAVSTNVAPMIPGTHWWQFWPLVLLMVGLCLIVIPVHTRFETSWHAAGIVVTSLSATALPMSLGMVSWQTIPCALGQWWFLLIAAVVLWVVGVVRDVDALIVAGAFCFAILCLLGLSVCALPGELDFLTLEMPGSKSLRIVFQ